MPSGQTVGSAWGCKGESEGCVFVSPSNSGMADQQCCSVSLLSFNCIAFAAVTSQSTLLSYASQLILWPSGGEGAGHHGSRRAANLDVSTGCRTDIVRQLPLLITALEPLIMPLIVTYHPPKRTERCRSPAHHLPHHLIVQRQGQAQSRRATYQPLPKAYQTTPTPRIWQSANCSKCAEL